MKAAIAQKLVEQPIFTTYFKPYRPGTLSFGYVDTSLYHGDLIYLPVINTGTWYVKQIILTAGTATVTQPMIFGTSHPFSSTRMLS